MLDRYDESELLALVEHTLEPSQASELRKRLAEDPQTLRLIEAMCRDRALLTTDPEPALPDDLAERLETVLARPMLMDAFSEPMASHRDAAAIYRPGQQRRLHRRQRRLRMVSRLAVAAGLLMVVTAGIWTAVTHLQPQNDQPVASSMPVEPRQVRDTHRRLLQDIEEAWAAENAIVHHHLPPAGLARALAGAASAAEAASRPDRSAVTGSVEPADIVLVIHCHDARAAEEALTRMTERIESPVALVQNFSYEEATALEQAWLLAGTRGNDRSPAVAGTGRHRFNQLADRAREQYQVTRPNRPATGAMSRQLVGQRELAASLVQQLEFSSRGATHTITLPVSKLQALLAQLATMPDQQTSLQLLTADSTVDEQGDTARWLADRTAVQEALRALEQAGDESTIFLPVRIISLR